MTSFYFGPRSLILPLLLFVSILVSGCVPINKTRYEKPDLNFSDQKPLFFAAKGLKVVSKYKSPMRAPNIEHLMPLPPEKAVRRWVEDRIRTVKGSGNRLRVEIRSAAVTEVALPKTSSFMGLFSGTEQVRLDARVSVALQVINRSGVVRGEATVASWNSHTIDKGTKLSERRVVWFNLVDDLMRDVDTKLENAAKNHLAAFMR